MTKVRLMTWNVLYSEKADNILSLIKQIKPDVLCCQEITTESHINPGRNVPAELAKLLGGDYVYQQILSAMEKRPGNMGNSIISKFPITDSRKILVQEANSDIDYSMQNRGYIEAKLKIGDKTLIIGTTHLSYVAHFIETEARNKEADKLVSFINDNKQQFIITGDFNSAPGTKTINRMEAMLTPAGPDYSQNTFTTKPFSHNGFTVNDLEWRLDYIFATSDVKVLSSKIIKTNVSDHLPILAEIEI